MSVELLGGREHLPLANLEIKLGSRLYLGIEVTVTTIWINYMITKLGFPAVLQVVKCGFENLGKQDHGRVKHWVSLEPPY